MGTLSRHKTNKQKLKTLAVVYTPFDNHSSLCPATFWQIQFAPLWFPASEPHVCWEAQNNGGGMKDFTGNYGNLERARI